MNVGLRPFARSLGLAFVGFVWILSGCSDVGDSSDPVDAGIDIPAFSKGVSADAVSDLEDLTAQLGQMRGSNSENGPGLGKINEVLADIRRHVASSGRVESANRSDLSTYSTIVARVSADCVARRRTEKDASRRVESISGWVEKRDGASASCLVEGGWNSRSATSNLSPNEMATIHSQGQSLGVADTVQREFADLDLVRFSVNSESTVFNRKSTHRFKDADRTKESGRLNVVLTMRNKSSVSIQIGESIESSSIWLDDSTRRTSSSQSMVFVFKGSANPIVYRKSVNSDGKGVTKTHVVINDEVFAN
ncbi:MAG: hypothetical protein AB7G93_17040 [Bdellovibrionales bacterium]